MLIYCCPCLYSHALNKELIFKMSHFVRKQDYCLCENKGADQLCSNCEADQRLCFRYRNSTISHLLISKISNFLHSSGTVQASLCRTGSEFPKTGFLASSRALYRLRFIVTYIKGDVQNCTQTKCNSTWPKNDLFKF